MYQYQIPTMSRYHIVEAVYEISHFYLKDWRYTRRSNIVILSEINTSLCMHGMITLFLVLAFHISYYRFVPVMLSRNMLALWYSKDKTVL